MAFSLNNFTWHAKIALMCNTMKCRLHLTKHQQYLLNETLETCGLVCNQTLGCRTEAWEQHQEPLSLYETSVLLTQWKHAYPALSTVYLQVPQNIQQVKNSKTPNYSQTV